MWFQQDGGKQLFRTRNFSSWRDTGHQDHALEFFVELRETSCLSLTLLVSTTVKLGLMLCVKTLLTKD